MQGGWNKVWALQHALADARGFEWILLVDDDVVIGDKQRRLQDIVARRAPPLPPAPPASPPERRAPDPALVWPGRGAARSLQAKAGPEAHVIFSQEHEDLCVFSNFGMLVRNSPTGRRFVDMWWGERPKPPLRGCGYMDQCPMWRTVIRMLHEARGEKDFVLEPWPESREPGPAPPPAPAPADVWGGQSMLRAKGAQSGDATAAFRSSRSLCFEKASCC